eukprot:8052462-Pyramimonas_sp.AAC.1
MIKRVRLHLEVGNRSANRARFTKLFVLYYFFDDAGACLNFTRAADQLQISYSHREDLRRDSLAYHDASVR